MALKPSSPTPQRSQLPSSSRPRPVIHKDDSGVERVFATRSSRMPPTFAPNQATGGAAVWSASGLRGFAGGQPTNTWAQSGLRDAFSPYRDAQHQDPRDWRTTVTTAMKGRQ